MSPRPALRSAAFPAAALLALAACSDSTGPEVTDPRLFVALDAGGAHTCAVTHGKEIVCWGQNRSGQVGDGTDDDRYLPTIVSSGGSFETVSAGHEHSCALAEGGQAFCWGDNGGGQLGTDSDGSADRPEPVSTAVRFSAISAGYSHTCGLDLQGQAYCWGHNGYGQLGIGSEEEKRTVPGAVDTDLRFTTISAGSDHTCAVDEQARIHCWGGNRYEKLGAGISLDHTTSPALVVGDHSWKTVSAGFGHTCAVSTDDEAYCWGSNTRGQLGASTGEVCVDHLDREIPCGPTPSPVSGGHSFRTVSAAGTKSCGVSMEGTTFCWGSGPLGDGSEEASSAPVPVAAPVVFETVDVSSHSCVLGREGVAYCWGSNEYGQLGVGSAHSLGWLVPVPVKMW